MYIMSVCVGGHIKLVYMYVQAFVLKLYTVACVVFVLLQLVEDV